MVLAARWFACSCILELACDFLAVLGVSLFAVLVPCYRSRLACGQLQVFFIFGNWEEGCEVLVQILERSWLSVVISGIFFFWGIWLAYLSLFSFLQYRLVPSVGLS
jgi:ABC-type proline/glycine betaine transport system permease subunit